MKAVRLHGRGGPDHLVYEDSPQPHAGAGKVLALPSRAGQSQVSFGP
jgi:NADPH:quinone reductase-like Zn-dependent oxidoreductase